MIDNKKVIDGQKEVIMHLLHMSEMCSENDEPYYDKLRNYAINTLVLLENLLKEQEPVTWSYKYNCFICSNCGLGIEDEVHYMMNKPLNFCPTCGRKVKWDD